jgi:hypothetical protein
MPLLSLWRKFLLSPISIRLTSLLTLYQPRQFVVDVRDVVRASFLGRWISCQIGLTVRAYTHHSSRSLQGSIHEEAVMSRRDEAVHALGHSGYFHVVPRHHLLAIRRMAIMIFLGKGSMRRSCGTWRHWKI